MSAFERVKNLIADAIKEHERRWFIRGLVECEMCGSLFCSLAGLTEHAKKDHVGVSFVPYKQH